VLIDHIKDLERATEFADRVNEPEVYSRLAKAFSDQGNVKAAIGTAPPSNPYQSFPPHPTLLSFFLSLSVPGSSPGQSTSSRPTIRTTTATSSAPLRRCEISLRRSPVPCLSVLTSTAQTDQYADLARYLQMCRKKVKEPIIDSELVYAYAKTNKLAELEEFINGSNVAQIQVPI
jgi:clathrin heavy chain